MSYKRVPLTVDQYGGFRLVGGWRLQDLCVENWGRVPGIQRRADTIAIMGSGDISGPRLLNGINAVAGFDHLVFESRPRPAEPAGNAYHYVVQPVTDQRFPYLLYGPFRSETRVRHWFESDDLSVYRDALAQWS